jgi:hypothetical protein
VLGDYVFFLGFVRNNGQDHSGLFFAYTIAGERFTGQRVRGSMNVRGLRLRERPHGRECKVKKKRLSA